MDNGDKEMKEQVFTKEVVDEALEKLEERKDKSNEMIGAFGKKAGGLVEKAKDKAIAVLDEQLNQSKKGISRSIEKVGGSQELSGYFKRRALNTLKERLPTYRVRDNSAFVLGVVKRCIDEHIDCTSLESFLASLPEPDISGTVKSMKEILGNFDGKNKHILINHILLIDSFIHYSLKQMNTNPLSRNWTMPRPVNRS